MVALVRFGCLFPKFAFAPLTPETLRKDIFRYSGMKTQPYVRAAVRLFFSLSLSLSLVTARSRRDPGLGRGCDDDARIVCAREAGPPRRELLVVALLLDVQQHAEQAHDAHARHQAWGGEALLQRVDGDGRPRVDAEAAVGVGCHCVFGDVVIAGVAGLGEVETAWVVCWKM